MAKSKKKLGIVGYSFLPRIGGCATLARMLAERLPALGWDVSMTAPLVGKQPDMGDWPEAVPVCWVRGRWARSYETNVGRAAFLDAMSRSIAARASGTDVWLALDFNVGALAAVHGVGRRRPVAAVFGADPLFELSRFHRQRSRPAAGQERPSPLLGLIRAALRLAYRRLDAVVVFSEASRGAAGRYTSSPVTPIFLSYDDHLFDRRTFDRSPTPELLVVSRLVPWKGVDRAIELFIKLRAERPDVRLIVAGDGPLSETLARRYGTEAGVELRFRVPAHEMPGLYGRAWALLHPSRYETFGLVIVEAMAAGTPVIARRISPLTELIDHASTGFLVPPGDDEAWLAAVRSVIDDREMADRIAGAARRKAAARFNVDRMVGLYDRLLTGLLRR